MTPHIPGLLDEHPLVLMPSLACALGDRPALFVQQLHYWLQRSEHRDEDGTAWVYNTFEDWHEQFPFWSLSTLKRIVGSLEERGVVRSCKPHAARGAHQKWYTVDYEVLYGIAAESTKMRQSKVSKWDDLESAKMARSTNEQRLPETTNYKGGSFALPLAGRTSAQPSAPEQTLSNSEPEVATQSLTASERETDGFTPAAETGTPPPPVRQHEPGVLPGLCVRGRVARNTPVGCADTHSPGNGPQKPTQQAGAEQQDFLADVEPAKPPQKRRKRKNPASEFGDQASRILADLGIRATHHGNPYRAASEAMELVSTDDLPAMLKWATTGWRSQYYRLERIAIDARAWRAAEANRKQTNLPSVDEMDLSIYDWTPEDQRRQEEAMKRLEEQEQAEKENWWSKPA